MYLTNHDCEVGVANFPVQISHVGSCLELNCSYNDATALTLVRRYFPLMHSVDAGVDPPTRETAQSELESENARLQLLLNLTNRITSNLEFHDLLRAISANIREVMHCEAVGIYLADSTSGSFTVH